MFGEAGENSGAEAAARDPADREDVLSEIRASVLQSSQHRGGMISGIHAAAGGGDEEHRIRLAGVMILVGPAIEPGMECLARPGQFGWRAVSQANGVVIVPSESREGDAKYEDA